MADKLTKADMQFESSGFDDFTGPIVDAWFEINPVYAERAGSDIVQLICKVEADGFNDPVSLGGFSCGAADKWDIIKGGKELVARKGRASFHGNSNAAVFVSELFRLAGGGDIEKGQEVFIARGYRMTQAEFFLGLESRWVRKDIPNPVDKEKVVRVQVATDFLNIGEAVEGIGKMVVKKATPVADEADIAVIQELASGENKTTLKQSCLKDIRLKGKSALHIAIVRGGLLEQLEAEGKLMADEDGKYI